MPSSPSRNETGPRLEATSTRRLGVDWHCMTVDQARVTGMLGPPSIGQSTRRSRSAGVSGSVKLTTAYAHPEGWRDRPCEAPATTVRAGAAGRPAAPIPVRRATPDRGASEASHGRCQLRPAAKAAGKDEGERPRPCEYASHHDPSRFGPATHLSCRECGATSDLGPYARLRECFGPLEVGYDLPAADPRRDRGRPAEHLALRQPAAGPAGRGDLANTEPGCTRLVRADHLAARARHAARCGSRTTAPTRPTRSRTGWSPSRSRPPSSSASRCSPAPRPATWPTRSPPRRRARGSARSC